MPAIIDNFACTPNKIRVFNYFRSAFGMHRHRDARVLAAGNLKFAKPEAVMCFTAAIKKYQVLFRYILCYKLPRFLSGIKITSFSGMDLTILIAFDEVQQMSLSALTSADELM